MKLINNIFFLIFFWCSWSTPGSSILTSWRTRSYCEGVEFRIDDKMRSLKALTDGASIACCGSAFQGSTIRFVKKLWRSLHPLTSCRSSLQLCPRRQYVRWPADRRCGDTKLTSSMPCTILNCSIKSPLVRRSSRVVSPSRRRRCS